MEKYVQIMHSKPLSFIVKHAFSQGAAKTSPIKHVTHPVRGYAAAMMTNTGVCGTGASGAAISRPYRLDSKCDRTCAE